MTIIELVIRWNNEARRHERAADSKWDNTEAMDEECALHIESARVLRNCARELEAISVR